MIALTLAVCRVSTGRAGCQDTRVTSQRGHSRAGHEGAQTVFVSGQDSDGFQTGELTAGLHVLVEKTEYQLTQVLQYTGKSTRTVTGTS